MLLKLVLLFSRIHIQINHHGMTITRYLLKECWKEKSLRGHLAFLTPSVLCKLMFTYTFRKRRRKEKQSGVGLGVKIGIREKNTFIANN